MIIIYTAFKQKYKNMAKILSVDNLLKNTSGYLASLLTCIMLTSYLAI